MVQQPQLQHSIADVHGLGLCLRNVRLLYEPPDCLPPCGNPTSHPYSRQTRQKGVPPGGQPSSTAALCYLCCIWDAPHVTGVDGQSACCTRAGGQHTCEAAAVLFEVAVAVLHLDAVRHAVRQVCQVLVKMKRARLPQLCESERLGECRYWRLVVRPHITFCQPRLYVRQC